MSYYKWFTPAAYLRNGRRIFDGYLAECFTDGFWALGTGNSLTNYMPVDNYLAVLDEGMKIV